MPSALPSAITLSSSRQQPHPEPPPPRPAQPVRTLAPGSHSKAPSQICPSLPSMSTTATTAPVYRGFLGNKYPNLLERIQRLDNPILNDLYYQVRRMTKLNLEAEQYVFDFLRAAQAGGPSADANAVAELKDQLCGLYYYNCLEPASEDYSDICMSCGYYADSREAPLENAAFQNTLILIRAEADYLMETLKRTYDRYLD